MKTNAKTKIVTIGGGKGQGTLLTGLRSHSDKLELAAIVSMVDNGGSTGRLREELGIPPFGGDFRDVMTALSGSQEMVSLFRHRYERGSEIKGHSVGNLILLGLLESANWDIPAAIDKASKILDIQGQIYPSTLDQIHLVAEYDTGEVVMGQDAIDNNLSKKYQTISKISTDPVGEGYPGAVKAIEDADLLILSPGDIYGSLLCNLIIPEINAAIAKSGAKIIYITNLMTKINQTHNWPASRFISEINRYLPRNIDVSIVNSGELGDDIAGEKQYKSENWEMVVNDIEGEAFEGGEIIKDKIWFEGKEFKRVSSDVIPRSFVRHDPVKLAEIILNLV